MTRQDLANIDMELADLRLLITLTRCRLEALHQLASAAAAARDPRDAVVTSADTAVGHQSEHEAAAPWE